MVEYAPTWEALAAHRIPEWFEAAKYGIFIHWGLYSVPGRAPLEADTQELMAQKGPAYWLKRNPYAEWYWNTIQIPGSPSRQHHLATYGPDFSYDDFKPMFNEAATRRDAVPHRSRPVLRRPLSARTATCCWASDRTRTGRFPNHKHACSTPSARGSA